MDGIYTLLQVALILNLCNKQIQRARGKVSNHAINSQTIKKIIEPKKEDIYGKTNFTHFQELFARKGNFPFVSYFLIVMSNIFKSY